MNIAIIHQKYTASGGMESYLMDLLKGFSAQGDHITLYVYQVNPNMPKTGITVHRMPLSFLPRRWRRYAFWRKLNATFNRHDFDLVISLTRTDCQDISVCGGTHLGMINRIPRHFRDRLIHDRIETGFERRMLKKVPHIMAHSKIIAQELKRYYTFDYKKISVLYPPIDTQRFKPQTSNTIKSTQEKYKLDPKKLNLLFPSSGHERKGLNELLEAFEQLSDQYQLYLVGTPTKKDLPKNVHFLGYINDLAPLYAAANYTILPSYYEPFGLVVPESLACLTPVIVTKHLGASELLTEKEAVILPDNNPATLIQAIKNLPLHMTIEPGFPERHQLTIEQHINAIKKLKRAH
jgi:glycosyltransferase involved in cell wall biosynthesis